VEAKESPNCAVHAERSANMQRDIEKLTKRLDDTDKTVKDIQLKLSAYTVYFSIAIGIFVIVGGFLLNATLDGIKNAVEVTHHLPTK
jgi:hypothetical protein